MNVEGAELLRKSAVTGELKNTDTEALDKFLGRPRRFVAGTPLTCRERTGVATCVLLDGWAASSMTLADGKTQIIDFRVPGDLLNAYGDAGGNANLEFTLLTGAAIRELQTPIDVVLHQASRQPAAMLLRVLARDTAIMAEHLVNVGRRAPKARTAHLLLELGVRLQRVGLGAEARFNCPLTQVMLADALGMSGIHLNRVLRQLRELGLVRFHSNLVEIDDIEKLAEFAGFDRQYLE